MAASGPGGVSVPAAPPTVTELLLAQAGSPQPGLRFEDRSWSWREHVAECARYAAADRWNTGDPVWWRPGGRSAEYVPLDPEQAATLDAALRDVR